MALIKRLRNAKKNANEGERPETVRTHLRNMIIIPEMIGSVAGVYNGTNGWATPALFCLRLAPVRPSARHVSPEGFSTRR